MTSARSPSFDQRSSTKRGLSVSSFPLSCPRSSPPPLHYYGPSQPRPALPTGSLIISRWNAHYPILLASPGVSESDISVVKELHPKSKGGLNDKQWAVLRYADEMTRHVDVPQSVFDELKGVGFNEQEIVEITVTVASYNMVSR